MQISDGGGFRNEPGGIPPASEREFSVKFAPMQALLDDGEILAIHPSDQCFSRLRRAHRRIFTMYVAEFRADAAAVVRARLTDINARSAWQELGATLALASKLSVIWGGFYLVWCAHGLHLGNGRRAVTRLLEMHQTLALPKILTKEI